MKNFTKVILVNFFILFILFLFAEFATRLSFSVKKCIDKDKGCSFLLMKSLKIKDDYISKNLNISTLDENLGYKLSNNFDQIINAHGWDNIRLSTDKDGFRHNKIELKRDENTILVVGDSYTLGEEVQNHETWPSCLQMKINSRVDNAGVFGYGTLQSLLRANFFINKYEYSTLIMSILVDNDFGRDAYSYRSGFAKPYLQKNKDEIKVIKAPDPYRPGTKFNPNKDIFYAFSTYSFIYSYLSSRSKFLPNGNYDRLTVKGNKAAEVNEIIPWIIEKFSRLKVKKKIILLQYGQNLESQDVIEERKKIIKVLNKYKSIYLIDTYQTLHKNEKTLNEKLWNPHHTHLGNKIVCEKIYNFFDNKL